MAMESIRRARLIAAWAGLACDGSASGDMHTSLNVTSGVNGASTSCGHRAQFTGTAALYTKLGPSTDLYLTGGRDLSDGILEHTVFLNTGALGLRHSFHRMVDTRVSLNGLQGANPKQSFHGTFVDGSLHLHDAGGLFARAGSSSLRGCRHAYKQSDDRCYYAVVDSASCCGS